MKDTVRGRLQAQDGSSLVETALSLSLLLLLIFGIIEMGMMMYSYHFISYAAREATRYAIVRGSTCSQGGPSVAGCPFTESSIQNYVKGLSFPGITIATSDVSVQTAQYNSTSGKWVSCGSDETTCNSPGDQVIVTIAHAFLFSVPFVKVPSVSLSSTSAMVIGQ